MFRSVGELRFTAVFVLALLAFPSSAAAQRDQFYSELLRFYQALGGVYGDEGAQLSRHVDAMSTALTRWDEEIQDWERQLRPRLNEGDTQVALQVHAFLASLYVERGRYDDGLREFDEAIKIDPRRPVFPRFKGLVHQIAGRPAEAAEAFRAARLLDPDDPQNAYRVIAFRSAQLTEEERAHALDSLRIVRQGVVRGTRPPTKTPFVAISGLVDDAGGGMAFAPAAYARGFSLVLKGDLSAGVVALRAALAADPLVADAGTKTPTVTEGLNALRQGRVADAIKQLETAVTRTGNSSEAHRMLATAYVVSGDISQGLEHLREAVRLNPRDERSRVALMRTLDQIGRQTEAEQVVRESVAALPDAGALRWQLAAFAARQQRTFEADVASILDLDRYVLLVGRADLYASLARFARTQLDYRRAIAILEQAIVVAPNNITVHKALGRAYLDEGREDEGVVEFTIALMMDPGDDETRIALGRAHLAADDVRVAIPLLESAVRPDLPNREAARALGEALIVAGRTAEGEKRLREVEQLQAQAIEDERRQRAVAILTLQAEVQMAERDYAGAIDLWQQLVTMRPRSASIHVRLADALVAAKRLNEAAESYQAAISLEERAEAHRRLAEVYEALGRPEDRARERARYVAMQLEALQHRTAGSDR